MPAGFGNKDGGVCSCARCLRRSGPVAEDIRHAPQAVILPEVLLASSA